MSRYDDYLALIQSDRVSHKTRAVLLARAEPDDPDYKAQTMDAAQFATLRAVLARVLPQDRVDVAQRLDRALAVGDTDGWRFAALAPDIETFRTALGALSGFASLDTAAQDAALTDIEAGERGEMLKIWFEDMRGNATMIYVSHPSTLARMGYGGIAYGGDEPKRPGFVVLQAGEREAWEPIAEKSAA